MGQELSPPDMELYRRIDEVLHYIWDPCSASDAPRARDEYYGYLPHVFRLLKRGAAAEEVAIYLTEIEIDRMGGASAARARAVRVAGVLVDWRDHVASMQS